MTRRKAVTSLLKEPKAVHEFIADAAKKTTRENRTWDDNHRGKGYYVPDVMREDVVQIRSFCNTNAQKHMTNVDNVARALITHSLEQVRKGILPIIPRPDPKRRNMTLVVVEGKGWSASGELIVPKKKGPKLKDLYINYRWGRDVDAQIKALAVSKAIPRGEMAVFLLKYAVDKFKSQELHFKAESVTSGQVVSWPQ